MGGEAATSSEGISPLRPNKKTMSAGVGGPPPPPPSPHTDCPHKLTENDGRGIPGLGVKLRACPRATVRLDPHSVPSGVPAASETPQWCGPGSSGVMGRSVDRRRAVGFRWYNRTWGMGVQMDDDRQRGGAPGRRPTGHPAPGPRRARAARGSDRRRCTARGRGGGNGISEQGQKKFEITKVDIKKSLCARPLGGGRGQQSSPPPSPRIQVAPAFGTRPGPRTRKDFGAGLCRPRGRKPRAATVGGGSRES